MSRRLSSLPSIANLAGSDRRGRERARAATSEHYQDLKLITLHNASWGWTASASPQVTAQSI